MGKLSVVALIFIALNCNPHMKKFDWLPTECAPQDYPVQVIEGYFESDTGEQFRMAKGKTVNKGWGKLGTIFMSGDKLKPVPTSLHIKWYSFAEDVFYQISLDLDAAKATALFSEPYISPVTDQMKEFDYLMVAMAPGGTINVWLYGEQVVVELAHAQAEPFDYPWEQFFPSKKLTREEYRKLKMTEVMDGQRVEEVLASEVPKERYAVDMRVRFDWNYDILGEQRPISVHTDFINGEREYLHFEKGNKPMHAPRPIPQKSKLRWAEGASVYMAEILFDESETTRAMKLLSENGNGPMDLQMQIRRSSPRVELILSDEESFIKLEGATIQIMRIE